MAALAAAVEIYGVYRSICVEMNRREFLLPSPPDRPTAPTAYAVDSVFARAASDAKIDWTQFKGTDRCYLA
jgi:hypothetical protein